MEEDTFPYEAPVLETYQRSSTLARGAEESGPYNPGEDGGGGTEEPDFP